MDAELGYRWQSWFNDSFSYVRAAVTLTPNTTRPSGYPLYLWLLSPPHSYLLVTASQHLMGLLVAVMIYALARHRFGAPAWVAVLATLPVLYDGFEIQLEHLIMADTLFLFLAMAAVTVAAVVAAPVLAGLPGRRPAARALLDGPAHRAAAARGVRGVPAHPAGIADWRRRASAGLAACGLAFAVPVLGYEAWYKSAHGEFAMTDSTGVFLYSRVMTFADCSRMSLPTGPAAAVHVGAARPAADRAGLHLDAGQPRSTGTRADVLPHGQQARRAVRHRGHRGAAARLRARGLGRHGAVLRVEPLRLPQRGRRTTRTCSAPSRSPSRLAPYGGYSSVEAYYARGNPATVVVSPFAAVIRGYQRYVWLPGTVYGLILLVGLFGIAGRWRRAGRAALLPWLCSLALVVAPGGDGGVRLPVRHDRGAVRLPSRRDGVRHGGPRAPRRGRRP